MGVYRLHRCSVANCINSCGFWCHSIVVYHRFVAVLLTLVILVALVGMRLPKSLDSGGVGLFRVIAMIATSVLSMVAFVLSFIKARR